MPTQRPYFANFLAAFRTHSALKTSASTAPSTTSASAAQANNYATLQSAQPQSSTSSSSSSSVASSTPASHQPTSPQPTPTRPIPGKTQGGLAAAAAAFSPTSAQHHTRHTSNVQSRSPATPLGSAGGGKFGGRARRGSDSSSDGGFRDALGGEKWFIGGRTASGEEKFYGLAMVRRERSGERASVDRMSL